MLYYSLSLYFWSISLVDGLANVEIREIH